MSSNIFDTEVLFLIVIGVVLILVGAFLGIGVRHVLGKVGPAFQAFSKSVWGGILSFVLGIALAYLIGVVILLVLV